jgi:hypothetical protein
MIVGIAVIGLMAVIVPIIFVGGLITGGSHPKQQSSPTPITVPMAEIQTP